MLEGPVREPFNTWSNLGFVIAGIAVGWRAMKDRGEFPHQPNANLMQSDLLVPASYAAVAVFLGPASAAMHASGTRWGGRIDVFSMFLWASWCIAYQIAQLLRGQRRLFFGLYGTLIGLAIARIFFNINPLDLNSNSTFGLLIVFSLLLGIVVRLEGSTTANLSAWLASLISFLVAFGVFWIPNVRGWAFCHPQSWIPGHAIWHLLCAVSVWFVYVYFRSERLKENAPSDARSD